MLTLGEKAADGLHTHEGSIGIMHNTEAVLRADVAAARSANQSYQTAKVTKTGATDSQSNTDSDAVKFIMAARDVLKPRLGPRWSTAWNAAGFINQSLEVPGTLGRRMELLKSLELYFTANPTHEVAALNITAVRATALHTAFSDAVSAANAARGELAANREPRALLVHDLQHAQPVRRLLARRPAMMKLREMNDINARVLQLGDEARRFQSLRDAIGLLLFLPVEEINRVLDMVVTRERLVAGQFGKAVAVRVTPHLLQRLFAIAGAEQIENAKVMLAIGGRIEPRHPALVAIRRLANAEAEARRHLAVTTAEPREGKIVREIQRIEILVRRRKDGDGTIRALGHHGPLFDGQRARACWS